MEQLRHRLANVSPKGRRCSVDQNTLKRTDLDDFVADIVEDLQAALAQFAEIANDLKK